MATVIAINGLFCISLRNGIDEAEVFAGASDCINSNSFLDKFLLLSGKDVTVVFQKKYQKKPKAPKV